MFALWPGFATGREANAGSLKDFVADCKADSLPEIAIVEPPYSSADDHPTHDPRRGQQFLGFIVDALLQSPSWKSTAFILTYDEHGGFFDHVPPPSTPEGAPSRGTVRASGCRRSSQARSRRGGRERPVRAHVNPQNHRRAMGLEAARVAGPRLPKVKSLWDSCFEFGRARGRAGSSIAVPAVSADWRAQITPTGRGRCAPTWRTRWPRRRRWRRWPRSRR